MRILSIKRLGILLLIFFLLGLSAAGCNSSPKEETKGEDFSHPKLVLDKFYQFLINEEYEQAYDLLASENKKNLAKEDYVLFNTLANETNKLEHYNISSTALEENITLEGVEYQKGATFKVLELYTNDKENKGEPLSYVRKMVYDGQGWHIYYENISNLKKVMSYQFYGRGLKYFRGSGAEKDLDKAKENFAKAVLYDPNFVDGYFKLGLAYIELEDLAKAIENLNIAIEKGEDNINFTSSVYNNLGVAYSYQNNYAKARECYEKALDLNPNNENAKGNLKKLEQTQ